MARKPSDRPQGDAPRDERVEAPGVGLPLPDGGENVAAETARGAAQGDAAAPEIAPEAAHDPNAAAAPDAASDAVQPPEDAAPEAAPAPGSEAAPDATPGAAPTPDDAAPEAAHDPDPSSAPDAAPDPVQPPDDAAPEATAPGPHATPEADAAAATVEESAPPPLAPAPVPAVVVRRGPGVLALVAGGMLAAVVGFAAARFVVPEGWPFGPVSQATRTLTAALDTQAGRIDGLETALAAAQDEAAAAAAAAAAAGEAAAATAAQVAALAPRLDALEAGLAAATDDAAAARAVLVERVTALERRPAPDGSATARAIESFEAEVAGLRALLEQERARAAAAAEATRAAAAEAEAEARARATEVALAAARAQLAAAIDAGTPLGPGLDALAAAGIAAPEALAAARPGVATLESLQDGFADAARAALATRLEAPPDPEAGLVARVMAFLRAQVGVRSLAPRAGDDLDAVLSRAAAAVAAGDLAGALAKIATLPEAARAAMAGWVTAATARQAALGALAALGPQ